MPFVQERTLARLWSVRIELVKQLAAEHGWTCHRLVASPHYDTEEIDAFLASKVINFARPPTVEDLLQKRVVLLKTGLVTKRLDISYPGVDFLVHSGKLSAVRVAKYFLIDEASVQRAEMERDEDVLIMRSRVAHVLGIDLAGVTRYAQSGQLTSQDTTQKRKAITRESLEAFLLPRLFGISPYDWINTRLSSERELLSASQHAYWADEFDLSKVAHITHRGRRSDPHLVLPESALAYLCGREVAVSAEELLQLLGYQPQSLPGYRRDYPDFFRCPLHDHDSVYRQSCILAMLDCLCISGMTSHHWYRSLRDGDTIVTLDYARQKLRKKKETIHRLIQLGRVPCLKKHKRGVVLLQSTVDFLSTAEGRKVLDGAA